MRKLVAVMVGCLAIEALFALEIKHWERLPLTLDLVVGQERVVFIDRNVRVAIPAAVADRLRVQSAGGAVYLRASAPLEPTRVQLQDAESGALVLLDIAAQEASPDAAPLEPVRIVMRSASDEGSPPTSSPVPRSSPTAVVLTRYAAQSLYAPLRTVEPVPGITPLALAPELPLDTLLPSQPVKARALAAWRLGDEWVSAIKLTNTAHHPIVLDPRALVGDFWAATFQHQTLGRAGDATDTTVLYLVTRERGLSESLLPRASAIDSASNLPGDQQRRGGQP